MTESTEANKTITWNYLVDRDYWTLRLTKVTLGDREVPISTSKAIVDTGTSYLVMPTSDFNSLINIWKEKMTCSKDEIVELYQCSCSLD